MNNIIKTSLAIILCAAATAAQAQHDGSWGNRSAARKAATAAATSVMTQRMQAAPGTARHIQAREGRPARQATRADETTTVLYEDFSKMTLGTEDAPEMSLGIVGSDGYIYYDYVQTYGWAGLNVYSAGGCCYLADGTEAFINTPVLDLSGSGGEFTIRVSFKAVEDTRFYITAIGSGGNLIDGGYVNATTEWMYADVPVAGGLAQTVIQFFGDAPVYIDDVIVTQEAGTQEPASIEAPSSLSATDITDTGFTASWNAVTDATGYLLDVFYYGTDNERTYAITDREVAGTTCTVDGLEAGHTYFFTVQATDGTLTSAESQQVIVRNPSESIGNPTATEATEVTDNGFRANWTAAENAAWYTLYTYSYHTVAETGAFEVEHETFDKFTEGTVANPLYNGTDVILNDYTEHPNWEGVTTMSANGMLGLRNYYSIMGYYSGLYTPIYSVSSASTPGQVTVRLTAMRDAACSASTQIGLACINADDMDAAPEWQLKTFASDTETFEFTMDAYKNYYIAIAFDDPENQDYGTTGTVWIDDITISQQLNAGDVFSRMHSADVVFGGTSFYVETPNRGDDTYSYFVQATTNGASGTIDSDFSNEVYVEYTPSGISQAEATGAATVRGTEGGVEVTLGSDARITVYSPSGAVAAATGGKTGTNRIALPKGLYIVKAGTETAKVIVR